MPHPTSLPLEARFTAPQQTRPPRSGSQPNVEKRCLTEADHMKLEVYEGYLDAVHRGLSRYLLTQMPTSDGKLRLSLFHESVTAAITSDQPIILAYLFFMRVSEPSFHVKTAISARSVKVFQCFLEYGWNINIPLERSLPPALGFICDNQELTEWFLDHGADPNATCAWDYTPMSEAKCRASLDTIKFLFARGGDIKHGQLLHHAVQRTKSDTIELVGLLLDMGVPINEIQYESHPQAFAERYAFALGTPLHYAAEAGNCDLVSFLLGKGADPSIKNTKDRSVIATAKHLGQTDVVRVLQGFAA